MNDHKKMTDKGLHQKWLEVSSELKKVEPPWATPRPADWENTKLLEDELKAIEKEQGNRH